MICWLYGPSGQADRANIEGHVTTVTNGAAWPTIDLGTGVTATILNANGKDTMQVDGTTPVSGDHTTQGGSGPPSENDYSIALEVSYGSWKYATAGNSDGEYNTSVNSYTYNNIEAKLAPLFGDVDTMRANHHGSDHSSSNAYLDHAEAGERLHLRRKDSDIPATGCSTPCARWQRPRHRGRYLPCE